MGRPIEKKYYNPAPTGTVGGDCAKSGYGAIGGEAVDSTSGNVVIATITRGSGYYAANATATISAPALANGTNATLGTVYLFANGAIKGVQLVSGGAGYTSNPTITFFGANTGTATATVSLAASTTAPAIRANVFFTGASSGDWNADLVKQRGSKTWVADNANYTETVKLVTSPNLNPYSAGTMTVIATFSDGSQFNIAKITNRKVWSSTGKTYKWTFNSVSGTGNVSASDITVQVQSS